MAAGVRAGDEAARPLRPRATAGSAAREVGPAAQQRWTFEEAIAGARQEAARARRPPRHRPAEDGAVTASPLASRDDPGPVFEAPRWSAAPARRSRPSGPAPRMHRPEMLAVLEVLRRPRPGAAPDRAAQPARGRRSGRSPTNGGGRRMAARSSPSRRRTASPGGSGRSSPAAASARPGPAPNGSGPAPARIRGARIALVAASLDEVARVMVEGESGLLAVARCDERAALDRRAAASLHLPLGRRGLSPISAERPEQAARPAASFRLVRRARQMAATRGRPTWDNLMLGLRLGERPRTIVTTTPQAGAAAEAHPRLAALRRDPRPHRRQSRTSPPISAPRCARCTAAPASAARSWKGCCSTISKARCGPASCSRRRGDRHFQRSGAAGCTAVEVTSPSPRVVDRPRSPRLHRRRQLRHRRLRPWTRTASPGSSPISPPPASPPKPGPAGSPTPPRSTARSRIVAEKNQGGDMIASVLRAVDADLPVTPRPRRPAARPRGPSRSRCASRPAGRSWPATFPSWRTSSAPSPGPAIRARARPDRADAMVWAMTELFEKERAGRGSECCSVFLPHSSGRLDDTKSTPNVIARCRSRPIKTQRARGIIIFRRRSRNTGATTKAGFGVGALTACSSHPAAAASATSEMLIM